MPCDVARRSKNRTHVGAGSLKADIRSRSQRRVPTKCRKLMLKPAPVRKATVQGAHTANLESITFSVPEQLALRDRLQKKTNDKRCFRWDVEDPTTQSTTPGLESAYFETRHTQSREHIKSSIAPAQGWGGVISISGWVG